MKRFLFLFFLFVPEVTFAATYHPGDIVVTPFTNYLEADFTGQLSQLSNVPLSRKVTTSNTLYTHAFAGNVTGQTSSLHYYRVSSHSLYLCRQSISTGLYSWESLGTSDNTTMYTEFYNKERSYPVVSSAPQLTDCGPETCEADKVTYNLKQYDDPESLVVGIYSCYDGCQTTAQVLWNDCLAGSCVASIKYTTTGQPCVTEPAVNDTTPDPPDRCTDQINAKIQQCGGSLNVLSFDFESCTGECTPDACADQWTALVSRCGGIMAVSNWDAKTCSGSCASDPVPDPKDPDSEAIPKNTSSETTVNGDGSKEVKITNVYNVDGDTVTTTTTTTYDSSGNETGSSTTTSRGGSSGTGSDDGEDDEETFSSIGGSGFGTPYASGEYDIPARFTSFLNNVKSSGLFSFSSSFFNSLPSGGSSILTIEGGDTFGGTHTFDFSQSLGGGLTILKSVLLALFGFLSIRAIIMKR